MPSNTYSFETVTATIVGPNGTFAVGYSTGVDDGGVTVEMTEDKGSMTTGADGTPMHTLHSSQSGRLTIRFQKTSPTNALLQALYDADTADPSGYGQNTIVITDVNRGDLVSARQCGQVRFPGVTWGKEGPPLEWSFNCGIVNHLLGTGS